jgi:membrane associated rhomboid family serine protease
MIIIAPVGLVDSAVNSEKLPDRSTPVMWVWLALVCALFVTERLIIFDHTFALQVVPEKLFAGVTFVVASWSCYSDSALFAPWQLWSHALIQASWWQLASEIAIMMVIGRAVERMIGSLAMAMALLTLLPMSATWYLMFDVGGLLVGGHGLCLSILGLAVGRIPHAQVQWGLAYWIIIAVGYVPLFALALPMMIVLYVVMVIFMASSAATMVTALWAVTCVLMGVLVGLSGPRLNKTESDSNNP